MRSWVEIQKRNKKEWRLAILAQEVSRLSRERDYLLRKAGNTMLSPWERKRIARIGREIQLIGRLFTRAFIEDGGMEPAFSGAESSIL